MRVRRSLRVFGLATYHCWRYPRLLTDHLLKGIWALPVPSSSEYGCDTTNFLLQVGGLLLIPQKS